MGGRGDYLVLFVVVVLFFLLFLPREKSYFNLYVGEVRDSLGYISFEGGHVSKYLFKKPPSDDCSDLSRLHFPCNKGER